jgi:hypothetical protein
LNTSLSNKKEEEVVENGGVRGKGVKESDGTG